MSNGHPRPSRARRLGLFQVEILEDRALLSAKHGATDLPDAGPIESVAIDTPSSYVSQQATALDVTLVRSESEYVRQVDNMINLVSVPPTGALTVNFSASLGSAGTGGQNVSLPASANGTFTPINESITFPAGTSTETVRIPINSGAPNPGSVPIDLSVTSSSPGVDTSQLVYLVTGPAALPPTPTTITSAHLIFQGKSASGIAITFSQPMSPASVENLHNYAVTTKSQESGLANAITGLLSIGESTGPFYLVWSVALKAAQYEPTTNMVTLIPKKPLKASVVYEIQNATPLANHTLTDLQGNAVHGNGAPDGTFSFSLKGHQSHNWAAPEPATIFSGN